MIVDRTENAKHLIEKGFRVIPCRPGLKVPATVHGCKDFISDAALLNGQFTHDENIGIVTGAGLVALDMDGADIPDKFRKKFGQLPATVAASTPRGGFHYYFRVPAGREVRNSASKIMDKVDVRGDGGYVMCHPSIVNGKKYEWVPGCSPDEIEIAEAPSWLLDIVAPVEPAAPAPAPDAAPTARAPTAGRVSDVERCRKYLQKLPPGIMGKVGSNPTFEAACVCFRFGLDDADAWTLLLEYNATCQPPWSEQELRHKLGDARKAVETAGEYGKLRDAPKPQHKTRKENASKVEADIQLTDVGNGIRFAKRHGQKIRMVAGIGWHVWDGRRWQFDDTGAIERLAKETCRALLAEALAAPGMPDKNIVMHWLRSEGVARLQAMMALAASEAGVTVRATELDADPWLLNVQNGILDLRDGTLRAHDPAALMSKLAPVTFDRAARCPRFDQFICEVFNSDADTFMYVVKLLGICLTGDITEQILPIFWGEGANGKSTLLAIVMYILGDYAGTAPESLLAAGKREEHPCELADLQGKRLIVAAETESGARLKMQLIKRLTGEETIKARRMRENFYEFTRVHKIILQTNNRPRVNENSEAVWRRLKLVPFTVTFPRDKQDQHLLTKLKAESSGILNRLIEGCLLWQKEGLCEPDAVRSATGDYRDESDPLREFIEERCVRVHGAWTATSELYSAYARRCEAVSDRPMGKSQFTDALGRHGFTARRTNKGRGWDGIGLAAEVSP
ncbi:MAG: hypothetical protein HKL96_04270 [Phycisphaerales bacterium]|nr:hypothetical protein [Phycisphaerales bacterium]